MIRQFPRPLTPRCLLLRRSTTNKISPLRQRLYSSSTTSSPADKPRSWRNTAARWGIAGGLVYYYSTATRLTAFAEEPEHSTPGSKYQIEEAEEPLPTLDEIAARRRRESAISRTSQTSLRDQGSNAASTGQSISHSSDGEAGAAPSNEAADGEQGLESEDPQAAAFNPETGEINWDCPCLGGMAHGSCGEEFKAAFSCFVYSTEEPKGMDCIDRFKGMQDCFRRHPEEYGDELGEGEEDEEAENGVGGQEPLVANVQKTTAKTADNLKEVVGDSVESTTEKAKAIGKDVKDQVAAKISEVSTNAKD